MKARNSSFGRVPGKEPWVRAHKLTLAFGCVGLVGVIIAAVNYFYSDSSSSDTKNPSAVSVNVTQNFSNGMQPSVSSPGATVPDAVPSGLHQGGPCPYNPSPNGWGPDRPILPIDVYSPFPAFNQDKLPEGDLGDERGFYIVREVGDTSADRWKYKIQVQRDKTYILRIFIHNSSTEKVVANNARLKVSLPNCTARYVPSNAFLTADNAYPSEVWGGVEFFSPEVFNLAYVPGTAYLCNNSLQGGRCSDQAHGFRFNTDDFLTSKGVLLGYDKLDGRFPGGYKNSAFFYFEVRPQFAPKS